MNLLPLSCYIRTLNEERKIREVVMAAAEICDEVIVVDSGSTDETIRLATEAGATVIEQPWLGEGFQKRVAEDACRNDWLLDLDADEVIGETLKESLKELFSKEPKSDQVFALKVATVPPIGRIWEFAAADYRNKIYHRKVCRAPASKVWSNLEIPEEVQIKKVGGYIEHYSFPSAESLMAKVNKSGAMRGQEKKLKSFPVVLFRVFFAFPWYLFRNLFQRGMWRYGPYCWMIATVVAFSRWLSDVKMYERHLLQKEG